MNVSYSSTTTAVCTRNVQQCYEVLYFEVVPYSIMLKILSTFKLRYTL